MGTARVSAILTPATPRSHTIPPPTCEPLQAEADLRAAGKSDKEVTGFLKLFNEVGAWGGFEGTMEGSGCMGVVVKDDGGV